MRKKATIADVARAAGVSISTVSYTISGNRSISAEVRKLVFSKIRELDYRPNLFARSMRMKKTQRIGVVMSEFTNPNSTALLQTISEKLRAASYQVVFAAAGMSVEHGRAELYSFSTGLVDGILNTLPQIDPAEASLLCGAVPVYTYMRDPYATYELDFGGAVRTAIDRFIALGHTRIGYLAPRFRSYQGKELSIDVFAEHLKQRELPFAPGLIVDEEDTMEGGERAMEKLFSRHPVTAVLTGNDLMALGVYRWAAKRGLAIPRDLSVIGSDDTALAGLVTPGLSTFNYSLEETADFTVRMLLEKISGKGEPHPPFLQTMSYVERGSTAKMMKDER